MPLFVHKDGGWKEAVIFVKSANVWREAEMFVRKAGAWKTLLPSLTVALDQTSVVGSSTEDFPTTDPVTATPSGGAAPYTYLWTFDSRDSGVADPSAPTSATAQFSASGEPGQNWSAMARCTVTDDDGRTAYALCAVYLERTYL